MKNALLVRIENLAALYENDKVKPAAISIDDFKDVENLVSEHAALVAVAEAAQYATCGGDCQHNRCRGIREALTNLATIRNQTLPVQS